MPSSSSWPIFPFGCKFHSTKGPPSQVPPVHHLNRQAVMMIMTTVKGNQTDQDRRDQRRKGSIGQGSSTLAVTTRRMVDQSDSRSSLAVWRDRNTTYIYFGSSLCCKDGFIFFEICWPTLVLLTSNTVFSSWMLPEEKSMYDSACNKHLCHCFTIGSPWEVACDGNSASVSCPYLSLGHVKFLTALVI